MKKKTLALLVTVALVASMTACGGKTEDAAGSNVNEPVTESSVESQVAESTTQESQEVVESTEASSEETSAVAETPYTMSEVVYPNGSTPEPALYEELMASASTMAPYFTVTNTSNDVYGINFSAISNSGSYEDYYFEPGETITVPAYIVMGDSNIYGEDGMGYWVNTYDAIELFDANADIDVLEANPNRNKIQEMATIAYDESKLVPAKGDNCLSVDMGLTVQSNVDYIIYYDEAGNVISSGLYVQLLEPTDTIFTFTMNDPVTGEPFKWASADIYYSYEVAQ